MKCDVYMCVKSLHLLGLLISSAFGRQLPKDNEPATLERLGYTRDSEGAYPFVAQMAMQLGPNEYRHICAATFVEVDVLVTEAHCLNIDSGRDGFEPCCEDTCRGENWSSNWVILDGD
jgi:hypothetical protein